VKSLYLDNQNKPLHQLKITRNQAAKYFINNTLESSFIGKQNNPPIIALQKDQVKKKKDRKIKNIKETKKKIVIHNDY
jgi:hypothetical protein